MLVPQHNRKVWPLHMVYWDPQTQLVCVSQIFSLTVTHGVLRRIVSQWNIRCVHRSLTVTHGVLRHVPDAWGMTVGALGLTVTHGVLKLPSLITIADLPDVWPLHMVYWNVGNEGKELDQTYRLTVTHGVLKPTLSNFTSHRFSTFDRYTWCIETPIVSSEKP